MLRQRWHAVFDAVQQQRSGTGMLMIVKRVVRGHDYHVLALLRQQRRQTVHGLIFG